MLYFKDKKEIENLVGLLVLYSMFFAYEVKEVKNDKRLSITGWLKTS